MYTVPNDADSSGGAHVAPLDAQLDITAAGLHPDARERAPISMQLLPPGAETPSRGDAQYAEYIPPSRAPNPVLMPRPSSLGSRAATPLFIPGTPYRFDEDTASARPTKRRRTQEREDDPDQHDPDPSRLALPAEPPVDESEYFDDLPISTQGRAVDERGLPVLPHTWARPLEGEHHTGGKLVLVISSRRYLYVPANEHDDEEFTRYHQCASSPSGYDLIRGPDELPYCRGELPAVQPTQTELSPYRRVSLPQLICVPATWNTPAVVAGDRVAVVDGEFAGAGGYIVDLCKEGADLCVQLVRAQWDPISPPGVFTAKMQDVQRHALDHPFEGFMVQDRVLVLLGTLYWDTTGYIVAVNGDELTIGVPHDRIVVDPTRPSPEYPHMKIFEVPIYNVCRQFLNGDWVQVARADLRGKDFVILDFLPGGIVVLYDADHHDIDQEFDERYLAQVPIADLVWDPKWHIDPIADQIFHRDPNTTAPVRRPRNMSQEEFRMKLAGHQYEGIPVQVNKDAHKGLRGVVVGDHDSADRIQRLKSAGIFGGRTRGCDQDGILLTIGKEMSNLTVENVPIEKVLHQQLVSESASELALIPNSSRLKLAQARFLPHAILFGNAPAREEDRPLWRGPFRIPQNPSRPPTPPAAPAAAPLWTDDKTPALDSEESGQWMSLPQLTKKRVDVKVVGVTKLSRPSPRMQALEGKFGYLLIDTPIPTADSKVTVYAVGKNQMKHDVPRKCIKPRREGNMGESFWEMNDRVVVLGPDLESNSSRIGEYGQIMPSVSHPRGRGVLAVKFVGLDSPAFYYVSMLSLAKNEKVVNITTVLRRINTNVQVIPTRAYNNFSKNGDEAATVNAERRLRLRQTFPSNAINFPNRNCQEQWA
ncbi:hypothetical protein K438DRAFT_1787002 [Mycena galopus ATCC 62051]|nr:hypothetical protein K438DRAFT_1787002 [Mycena galopus ATCC 62051]